MKVLAEPAEFLGAMAADIAATLRVPPRGVNVLRVRRAETCHGDPPPAAFEQSISSRPKVARQSCRLHAASFTIAQQRTK